MLPPLGTFKNLPFPTIAELDIPPGGPYGALTGCLARVNSSSCWQVKKVGGWGRWSEGQEGVVCKDPHGRCLSKQQAPSKVSAQLASLL